MLLHDLLKIWSDNHPKVDVTADGKLTCVIAAAVSGFT